MSQTKANHLAEIVSMMRLYGINLNDIDSYEKAYPKPLKETPRLILFLAYLGGLLVLGGVGIFLKDHWSDFGSIERILMTYGVGTSLYITSLALYYKKVSTLTLSNLFVIAFVFQWGGLGVAIKELFPDGNNIPLFILSLSSMMLLQTSVTFARVRLTSILFMVLIFLSMSYGALVSYLYMDGVIPHKILKTVISARGVYTLDLFAIFGGLLMIAITQKVQQSQYRIISGVWYFAAMALFYMAAYQMLSGLLMKEFFGLFVLVGMVMSQALRSKIMLTLTALALCSYLVDMTTKYFLDTPWWPLALVSLGVLVIIIALSFYRKVQNLK